MNQLSILTRFFEAIKKNANSQWSNPKTNALIRFPGVNAMLLTLTSILKKYPKAGVNMNKLLKNIDQVKFSRARLKHIPRGYSAINQLHEEMINAINKNSSKKLKITKM